MPQRFDLSGHRGARDLWPENTLAGFAGTLRLGVDALEFDVVLTADGVPVVTHDLTLNPDLARDTDGRWIKPPGPPVCSLTLAQLQQLDVGRPRPGSGVAARHPRQVAVDGQTVPTLDAVLHVVAPYPVRLELELKTDPARPEHSPDPPRLARLVLQAAARAGVSHRVVLRSFDWRGLRYAAGLAPEMRLCFLSETADFATLAAIRREADGRVADWAPRHTTLSPEAVLAAQDAGLAVLPWTVNREEDIARLIRWGVDGICTDAPDIARAEMARAGLALPTPLAAA